jgi:prepilin-type N-terminal cleavage/methylation domain-containing protein
MNRTRAFTLIELLVVVSIIALLIAILLPSLQKARTQTRQLKNSTNLRDIHRGMVLFAEDNNGRFPGVDKKGNPIGLLPNQDEVPSLEAGAPYEGWGNDGRSVSVRLAILLNQEYATPEILISPGDKEAREPRAYGREDTDGDGAPEGQINTYGDPGGEQTIPNFSYAFLGFRRSKAAAELAGKIHDIGRYREWQNSMSVHAIIATDRVLGNPYYSVWTNNPGPSGKHNWQGTVVRNDNSTTFERNHVVSNTRYGRLPFCDNDDIFGEVDEDERGNPGCAWMRWD